MKNIKQVFELITILLIAMLTACGNGSTINATMESQPAESQPVTVNTETAVLPTASPTEAPAFDLSTDLQPLAGAGSYLFTEGPATDGNGNVYFSDINAGRIYKWSTDGSVAVFIKGLNMPNGLMFDKSGNLVVCEGGNGRLISIDPQGRITVLVDRFDGLRFNEPNDLWIDAQGGIYFTDPAYLSPVVQEGEHVYYLWPDRLQITRVINDMVRPNGIVGTPDGKTLYVADHGAGQTYAFTINSDGVLSDKRLIVSTGSDGMTLDSAGNLYLTVPNQVEIYDAFGTHLKDIPTPENPTNVTFAGADGMILFITARTVIYTVRTSTQAAGMPGLSTPEAETMDSSGSTPNTGSFTLTSPDLPPDGRLPIEYTCDGTASTLALNWNGAPDGTLSYAVIMDHIASPEDIHWYLVLYNIPVNVTSLPKNFSGIGTLGTNSVNERTEYSPPCSKGPGDKTYTYTVYALSAQPQLSVPTSEVDRAALLAALEDITLASAKLNVVYARQ